MPSSSGREATTGWFSSSAQTCIPVSSRQNASSLLLQLHRHWTKRLHGPSQVVFRMDKQMQTSGLLEPSLLWGGSPGHAASSSLASPLDVPGAGPGKQRDVVYSLLALLAHCRAPRPQQLANTLEAPSVLGLLMGTEPFPRALWHPGEPFLSWDLGGLLWAEAPKHTQGDFGMWSAGKSGHIGQAKSKPIRQARSLPAETGLLPLQRRHFPEVCVMSLAWGKFCYSLQHDGPSLQADVMSCLYSLCKYFEQVFFFDVWIQIMLLLMRI